MVDMGHSSCFFNLIFLFSRIFLLNESYFISVYQLKMLLSVPNVPMIPMIDEERKKEKRMARVA